MRTLRRETTVSVMQEALTVEEYRYRASVVRRAGYQLAAAAAELPGPESRASWSGPARDVFDAQLAAQRSYLEATASSLAVTCHSLLYLGEQTAATSGLDCG